MKIYSVENRATEGKRKGLSELSATAISGNDITSSCLYVSALAIIYSGQWAWLSLLIVAAVLFLFRKIYTEVVEALPLNGGAYNALLNTTSKRLASLAACLTILSYMATAVISASEAMHYAHSLWNNLPVLPATIMLLGIFMTLTIMGIQESSKVAVFIFLLHLVTLSLLLIIGFFFVLTNGTQILVENLQFPMEGSITTALFFGFSAAMLGISGFESSANFVEEQAENVFPKTLRNMWIAVTIFNPAIAFLALALVPIPEVTQHRETLLAHMGSLTGGPQLSWLISVDASLVLSGAVLTSFVGVTGLIRRMTLDRCLPQFLLKTNSRGTTHRIIIGFFLLGSSILLVTKGDLITLAGVYTISFLAVMALFGLGNILLKAKRERLPRSTRASWKTVLLAIAAVIAAIVGNVAINPSYLKVFTLYCVPTILVVIIMLGRISILKVCLFFIHGISRSIAGLNSRLTELIEQKIDNIRRQQVVFFTRGDNLTNLNEVMLYVRRNESSKQIKIVTVVEKKSTVSLKLKRDLKFLNKVYPSIEIEFVVVKGRFGPNLIQQLSKEWGIPPNFMFIGSPGTHFLYGLAELGGVRMII